MELYIFSPDEKLLTILSEDTGLTSTSYRIEVNSVPDTPLTFTIDSEVQYEQSYDDSRNLTQIAGQFIGTMETESTERINVSPAQFVKEENKVVFKDHEGDWRMMVIRELDDSDGMDGPQTTATCEPVFLAELNDHIVVDRRFVDQTADVALDAALEGTRWIGSVEVELGLATTNFYYMYSTDAVFEIIRTWGGEFKDVVEFDEETNEIIACQIKIIQRLGADHGQRFEIDHNITEIERHVLSYPKTALYGRGSSLPIEDDEGQETGGHTRYIDFADVEWSTANGDPVDKHLGQRWVGDPDALAANGYENGTKHRFGIYHNQDYEDPAELLEATWHHLQESAKHAEVNYRLSVDLFDDKVSLGDTAQAIDRHFARPIEVQARIIALEYDLLDIEGTMVAEMGQFLDLDDDRLDRIEQDVDRVSRRQQRPISEDNFPNRKPSTPVNVTATGAFETIQLHWDYADEIFIKHYEVYGSQSADFVPDSQHLLWRGQVSAFGHTVNTDETWYYYVRAVNYHGTASDWSARVSASTVRIMSDDILFGEDLAERLRELNEISDIIGENGVDLSNFSDDVTEIAYDGSVRFKGDLIHLDGLTLIDEGIIQAVHIGDAQIERAHLKRAIINDAHIDELTGEVIVAKTITADHLDVTELSSVSADLGTVNAGLLKSGNNNTEWNLNTGEFYMNNADMTLGSGASIEFTHNRNQMRYTFDGRTAGIGVGIAIGGEAPYSYLGTTAFNNGELDTLDSSFSGFIANTTYRINVDGAANSINGRRFQFRNIATGYDRGMTFDFTGNPTIELINGHDYNYTLGTQGRRLYRTYTDRVAANNLLLIEDAYSNGGFLFTTEWNQDPTNSVTNLVFRGRNYGESGGAYRYNLGISSAPFSYGHIRYLQGYSVGTSDNPYSYVFANNVVESSDLRVKDNITNNRLGLDFINDLRTVNFRLIKDDQYKKGVIAQEVEELLIKHDVPFAQQSIVFSNDDVKAVSYTQLVPPAIKAIQELDNKLEDKVSWLKTENQLLKNEIKILKERIKCI